MTMACDEIEILSNIVYSIDPRICLTDQSWDGRLDLTVRIGEDVKGFYIPYSFVDRNNVKHFSLNLRDLLEGKEVDTDSEFFKGIRISR